MKLIIGGDDPIYVIVKSTYFDLEDHIWEVTYFQKSVILAPIDDIEGIGAPVILLRNMDQTSRIHLGNRIIEVVVMSDSNVGDKVFILRMTLAPSDATEFPIKFQKRSFRLVVCFVTTINKRQGQYLAQIGLYLPGQYLATDDSTLMYQNLQAKRSLKILI